MVLKITPEILKDAERLRSLGATKPVVKNLYRKDWLSMKEIAVKLSEDLNEEITMKHVNALISLHEIEKWTNDESRRAVKLRPKNTDNTKQKIKDIEKLGFDKTRLEQMYFDENLTKNEIITAVNLTSGENTLHKTWMNRIFDFLEIPEKSKALTNKRRKELIDATNLERYGVTEAMRHPDVKKKSADALIANGGYTLQRPGMLEKYRGAAFTPEANAKREATNLERYGTKNVWNAAPARKSWVLKYIDEELDLEQSREELEALSLEELLEITGGMGDNPSHRSSVIDKIQESLKDADLSPKNRSKGELELLSYVCSITSHTVNSSIRSLIYPQEVDIYIPELNLAIEYNGDYWHSDKIFMERLGITGNEYHSAKLNMCAEKGVTLLFVWESDWQNNRSDVENALTKMISSNSAIVPDILQRLTSNLVRPMKSTNDDLPLAA